MKLNKLFGAAMATVALFAAGCANESTGPQAYSDDAVMRISLAGNTTRATGTLPDESAVKHFTVYVFNNENNTIEAVQPVSGATSTTISGLSTGFSKKIVIVANAPATFPTFQEGDPYSKFTQAAGAINLTYQSPANVGTNGLVMVGETENPVTLNPTGITDVSVNLKRLVAKVKLGTVTIIPKGENDIDLFELTGVSIQRAYASVDIYGNPVNPTSMFCGIVGSWNSTPQAFLYDQYNPYPDLKIGIGLTFDNYFYVFPNQDPDNCTLLTVVSTYNGDEQYFPIRINANIGDQNTDGTYITSNNTYTVNLVVNNLNEGTTDPDLPPTEASINVTVEVDPWDLDIIQNVVW